MYYLFHSISDGQLFKSGGLMLEVSQNGPGLLVSWIVLHSESVNLKVGDEVLLLILPSMVDNFFLGL